jgi:uncharacterized membrane protein
MTELFNTKAMALEPIALMVMIVEAALSIGRFVTQVFQGTDRHEVYEDFRENFGLTLMLAVDLLVAVNFILTVAPLDLSFESTGMLGCSEE